MGGKVYAKIPIVLKICFSSMKKLEVVDRLLPMHHC